MERASHTTAFIAITDGISTSAIESVLLACAHFDSNHAQITVCKLQVTALLLSFCCTQVVPRDQHFRQC
jgi:hypothetical protein